MRDQLTMIRGESRYEPRLSISSRRIAMAPRLALFALIMAFGISAIFATLTTMRQVHLAHSSPAVAQHARG
jgi:predicted component of type VI protein secretion system